VQTCKSLVDESIVESSDFIEGKKNYWIFFTCIQLTIIFIQEVICNSNHMCWPLA
jgi:hypothetical protein